MNESTKLSPFVPQQERDESYNRWRQLNKIVLNRSCQGTGRVQLWPFRFGPALFGPQPRTKWLRSCLISKPQRKGNKVDADELPKLLFCFPEFGRRKLICTFLCPCHVTRTGIWLSFFFEQNSHMTYDRISSLIL